MSFVIIAKEIKKHILIRFFKDLDDKNGRIETI